MASANSLLSPSLGSSIRSRLPGNGVPGRGGIGWVYPLSCRRLSPLRAERGDLSGRGTRRNRVSLSARAEMQESEGMPTVDTYMNFKHVLLPITDRNPYLSEGTRQAATITTALAKKYGADITVVVIDDKPKESIPEHDAQLSSIRWHLSEGGFQEFRLMERLGEGKRPTAVIGEVADDLNLDLVVLSMEAIHSKHVDGNLLAEFIPCPVLLLPL
uniref:Universal stress protein Sll1654 n=1 Tax=Anthurium amnicola TaxID=1678845 RepID=A0A1D1XY92_9ARAE